MKTAWFKDCKTPQSKQERNAILSSADPAFKVLTGILEEKIQAKNQKRNSIENYDKPAFGEFQADASGYIRALEEIRSLITRSEHD